MGQVPYFVPSNEGSGMMGTSFSPPLPMSSPLYTQQQQGRKMAYPQQLIRSGSTPDPDENLTQKWNESSKVYKHQVYRAKAASHKAAP